MSAHAIKEAERARESYVRRGRPMDVAQRRGALIVGGSFLLAALALALRAGVTHFDAPVALLYVLAIAVAGNVRFDVGAGFTVPTQAIFVPMLFAVSPSLVPLLVALALAFGMTPRILRGELSPSWLSTAAVNSWFAIGPALVLELTGVRGPVGHWGILLLALGAQFACDFAASVAHERLVGGVPIVELVAECRPIYTIDLALSTLGLAAAYATIAAHSQVALVLFAPLFAMLKFFSGERRARLEQVIELNDAYQGTALLLGDVVEADDAYTGEHCKGVVQLSLDVARQLGLDADRTRNVELGALLHDVGKIAVPNEIINKPGKLDEREWEIMKRHTIDGQQMLERIGGVMNDVGKIVRGSHERWDGSGYPDGLFGEQIPLESRIVSACDAFNAMTTTRSYRVAMPFAQACAELERCAGSHFDPQVVRALLAVVDPLRTASGAAREEPIASAASATSAAALATDRRDGTSESQPEHVAERARGEIARAPV
jgi:putative nucleotidyltransferase with HDIG domain